MRVDATNADDVVSVERGEIDRRIYSDEEIFEQEMELIFGRAWLFLCHETQVRPHSSLIAVETITGARAAVREGCLKTP